MLNRSRMVEEGLNRFYRNNYFYLMEVGSEVVLYTDYPNYKTDFTFVSNAGDVTYSILGMSVDNVKFLDEKVVSSKLDVFKSKIEENLELTSKERVLHCCCNLYNDLLRLLDNRCTTEEVRSCVESVKKLNEIIESTHLYMYLDNDRLSSEIRSLLALCSKIILTNMYKIYDDRDEYLVGNSGNMYFNLATVVTEYGVEPYVNCFVG